MKNRGDHGCRLESFAKQDREGEKRKKKGIDGRVTKRSTVIERRGGDYEISKIRETRWNRWIDGTV